MKSLWKFFGFEAEIASVASLKTLGQAVELDAALHPDHPAQILALLPAAEFDKIGFTPEELTKYSRQHARGGAPEEFNAKLQRCNQRLAELRSGAAPAPAPPSPDNEPNGGEE